MPDDDAVQLSLDEQLYAYQEGDSHDDPPQDDSNSSANSQSNQG